jgi:hypothetical protein
VSDIAQTNAAAYAARHNLQLTERLGFGIHGTVYVAENKRNQDRSAIKAFKEPASYLQERAAYERLQAAAITQILGFHVPQLIRADDALRVIEMTIVTLPFVLDFASTSLDARPSFSDEIWAEWETEKREQFGDRWPKVQAVMDELEHLGIYLLDVSPRNIGFPH